MPKSLKSVALPSQVDAPQFVVESPSLRDPVWTHDRRDLNNTVVRFGTFELDLKNEQLRKSGLLVKLPPQPLKILVSLSTHAGQLVTRQELREPTLGTGNLCRFRARTQLLHKQIRLALGDDSRQPAFHLKQFPKRGYRFIAAVHLQASPTDPGETTQCQRALFRPRATSYSNAPLAAGLATVGCGGISSCNPAGRIAFNKDNA